MNITDLLSCWRWLVGKPLGPWLFKQLIKWINPYTGALRADIIELEPGYAKLQLKDQRRIRNHLNSIHAIALTNLGEFTSGLALITLFPENVRGIPVEINICFIKKARGLLTASCKTQLNDIVDGLEHTVSTEITDQYNEKVATVQVKWKLGVMGS